MKLLSSPATSKTAAAASIAILSLVLICLGRFENSSVFVAARKPPSRSSARSSSNARLPSSPSSRRATPVSSRKTKRPLDDVDEEDDDDDDVEFDTAFDDEDVPSVLSGEEDEEEDDVDDDDEFSEPPAAAKSRKTSLSKQQPPSSSRASSSRNNAAPPRRSVPPKASHYEEEEEEDDEEDSYEEEEVYPRPASSSRRQPPRSSSSSSSSSRGGRRGPPPPGSRQPQPRGGPPPRGGPRNPPPRSGTSSKYGYVVPYSAQQGPTAFTRGLEALKNTIPDPAAIREAAANSLKTARETTSSLSANLYREVKGLTSSELEQVMLKATKPDDTPVKGKHVERLVGVTYQISPRYDIYDAVLRKLWSKMAEKDWRTTLKSLYILHRFSADGAPEHAAALKARLRELRRTRDPKRKDKYFNSKQLLAGDTSAETIKFRSFMSRYAHYVILRAQCFGGMFDEIATLPATKQPAAVGNKKKKGSAAAAASAAASAVAAPKPITSTCLRTEHLEAAAMLLKAGVACQLKDGEECENTCIALERVVADLIGLTSAVAIALNRALKKTDDLKGADPAIIKKWCEFYKSSLLPQTKMMIKKTSSKLDAYGLFLPSRMGTTVSPEMLQKGLDLQVVATTTADIAAADVKEEGDEEGETAEKEKAAALPNDVKGGDDTAKSNKDDEDDEKEQDEEDATPSTKPRDARKAAASEKEAAADDEYEYEEEEYYDDDEEE